MPRPVPGTGGSQEKGAGTPALLSVGQMIRWLHCGLVMKRYVPGAVRVWEGHLSRGKSRYYPVKLWTKGMSV